MHVPHHDEHSRPIQAAVLTMLNGEDTGNRPSLQSGNATGPIRVEETNGTS